MNAALAMHVNLVKFAPDYQTPKLIFAFSRYIAIPVAMLAYVDATYTHKKDIQAMQQYKYS